MDHIKHLGLSEAGFMGMSIRPDSTFKQKQMCAAQQLGLRTQHCVLQQFTMGQR